MQPSAQQSTGAPYVVAPRRSSGARYHSVTTSGVSAALRGVAARASPKSHSLSAPARVSSRFESLRSRWRTQLAWRCATAAQSWRIRHLTSDGAKGVGIASSSRPSSCSQYSKTRKTESSFEPTATSCSRTTFGWRRRRSSAISRSEVSGIPSRSKPEPPSFTRFSATRPPVSRSRALYTEPYVPSPTFASFSNWPTERVAPLGTEDIAIPGAGEAARPRTHTAARGGAEIRGKSDERAG